MSDCIKRTVKLGMHKIIFSRLTLFKHYLIKKFHPSWFFFFSFSCMKEWMWLMPWSLDPLKMETWSSNRYAIFGDRGHIYQNEGLFKKSWGTCTCTAILESLLPDQPKHYHYIKNDFNCAFVFKFKTLKVFCVKKYRGIL